MVIERAFGVLKAHFPILSNMPKYKQYRQHLVVSACCALHNFIRINNQRDVMFNTWENLDVDRDDMQTGNNGHSPESSGSAERRHVREMSNVAKRAMGEFRDDMTDRMWEELPHATSRLMVGMSKDSPFLLGLLYRASTHAYDFLLVLLYRSRYHD
ncbi:hypothetical protein SO802_015730 [Lithocarpus litseifolius]|uniref:DDE Tnp4 domain-containing protein n=1 Tax=Lithocarpus litseifolius TaxID=425828 RepID=A0AAW2CV49_9ROSI